MHSGGGGAQQLPGRHTLLLLLVRLQVTTHCEERGRLLSDVWLGYTAMVDRWWWWGGGTQWEGAPGLPTQRV